MLYPNQQIAQPVVILGDRYYRYMFTWILTELMVPVQHHEQIYQESILQIFDAMNPYVDEFQKRLTGYPVTANYIYRAPFETPELYTLFRNVFLNVAIQIYSDLRDSRIMDYHFEQGYIEFQYILDRVVSGMIGLSLYEGYQGEVKEWS